MRFPVLKTLFLFTLFITLLIPRGAFADTLFFSPAAGNYQAGQTFSVRIMVSSQSQAINAVSLVASFPTDKLQVVSISKIGSILNLWVEEPSFSNTQGTISLEGVVPNPGFSGSSGSVITVNFKALQEGSATLRYSSGSLLANDGYGTNVLKNKGTATINISPASPQAPAPVVEEPVDEPEYVDLNKAEPKAEKPSGTISLEIPTWTSIYNWLIKFLSIVIPLVALLFFLMHTTKKGIGNMRTLRKDLHDIDRLVEKSFDLLKEDVNESIHILERARMKRRLTAEEDAIIHSLRQNLVDAERTIHHEIIHAEKDLGA